MEKELIIDLEENDITFEIGQEGAKNLEIEQTEKVIVTSADDYKALKNKPQINNIELLENKNFEDLGLVPLTNLEIDKILDF